MFSIIGLVVILSSSSLACLSLTSVEIKPERYYNLSEDENQQNKINEFCKRLLPNSLSYVYDDPNCTGMSCGKLFNETGFAQHMKRFRLCGLTEEEVASLTEISKGKRYGITIVEQTDNEYSKFVRKAKWNNFWKSKDHKIYAYIEREGIWTIYEKRSYGKEAMRLC